MEQQLNTRLYGTLYLIRYTYLKFSSTYLLLTVRTTELSMVLSKGELERILSSDNLGLFSGAITSNTSVEEVGELRLLFCLQVTPSLCNPLQMLHGGAIATAVDVFTTLALFHSNGSMSVTTDLHITCTSSAPLGSLVYFDCVVDRQGRTAHFASCVSQARHSLDASLSTDCCPAMDWD